MVVEEVRKGSCLRAAGSSLTSAVVSGVRLNLTVTPEVGRVVLEEKTRQRLSKTQPVLYHSSVVRVLTTGRSLAKG